MDYGALSATVKDKLKQFGKLVKIVIKNEEFDPVTGAPVTIIDPETGQEIPVPDTELDLWAVEDNFRQFEIDGTLIKAGDRKFLIETAEFGTDGVLKVGSEELKIINIKKIQPAGTVLMLEVQCRG